MRMWMGRLTMRIKRVRAVGSDLRDNLKCVKFGLVPILMSSNQSRNNESFD